MKTLEDKINRILSPILSLQDWEERYAYILRLADSLPEYPEYLKTPERKINGCQSNAWLDFYEEEGRLYISGTADSKFVRGFIHLLIKLYSREQICTIQSENSNFLALVGFQEMVNSSRAGGLLSIYKKIKNYLG